MYLLSWSSGGRNEETISDKANFTPTEQSRSPLTQIPLFNKMKRKRADSNPSLSRLDPPPPTKRTVTISHNEIPSFDMQRAILPNSETQTTGDEGLDQSEATLERRSSGMEREKTLESNDYQDHSLGVHTGSTFDPRASGTSIGTKLTAAPAALRQAIEAQFSLEILLKHRELRLIDQEFAKCQIALEQLRRCLIIPYLAQSSAFADLQAVSSGTGPVFDNRAPYAPPSGIANGPYSRHYERWLIPDSAFDDAVVDPLHAPTFGGKAMPERTTRGSAPENGVYAGKYRSRRGSNSTRLKALPHGYPEPKEEKGPMIVKRSSDGKLVKLVCLDCRRSNFNSAQGFINHCRIAHSRQFLSHDAAIEASGEEVDMDADGGLGEANGSQNTASAGLVHPLIRSAHLARTTPSETATSCASKRKKGRQASASNSKPSQYPTITQAMSAPPQTRFGMPEQGQTDPVPFKPSSQTPHLSALFAKIGWGGDLEEMVIQAKTKPDVDLTSSSDEEDELEGLDVVEEPNFPQSRSTRGVVRGGHLLDRMTTIPTPSEHTPAHAPISTDSHKPHCLSNVPGNCHYPSPSYLPKGHEDQGEHNSSALNTSTPPNLSPNTIESHTAPSLVSDDGDYENTHSDSETPSLAEADDDEDHYIHAEVMDHEEMDLGEGGSGNHEHHQHHLGLGGKPHGPAANRRTTAMRHPSAIVDGAVDERHVSFSTPCRRLRRGSRANDGE